MLYPCLFVIKRKQQVTNNDILVKIRVVFYFHFRIFIFKIIKHPVFFTFYTDAF